MKTSSRLTRMTRPPPPVRDSSDSLESVGSDRATVSSVRRAFDILGCFRPEQNTIGLSEAARAVDLPLRTVSRLLATLEEAGLARRLANGRYGPGGNLLRIGVRALHVVDLYDLCEQPLKRLADATGETGLRLPRRVDLGRRAGLRDSRVRAARPRRGHPKADRAYRWAPGRRDLRPRSQLQRMAGLGRPQ
jgi:DNA-binding transcriptional ArsR family regulator